jgi:purine-nucleoside phosphorylase
MEKSLYEKAAEAASYIAEKSGARPRIAVILGSGLSAVADAISDATEIPYQEIPHFVSSTVEGHEGRLVVGSLGGIQTALMKGRTHFYEGYSMQEITLPIRAFAVMGIRSLIITNAAGGASDRLGPGSLMLITDHLNLMGENPLRGPNDERFGPRFPDMTRVYAPDYIELAQEVARQMGITLAEGVYAALRGPSYETPAEVRMLRSLGADALGMSTVPEAIVARHCGMKVLAISCITNLAAGLTQDEINHAEVMQVGTRAGKTLAELIIGIIPKIVHLEEAARRT